MEIPFVGPSYNLDSRPSGVQRTVNLIPHPQEPGNERTAWVFQDVPGLVLVQDFAAAPSEETVLFLFHMTESASSEGIAEFTGASTAVDQTGAAWSTGGSPDWDLVASPAPKFGAFALRFLAGLSWIRSEFEVEYPTTGVSTLQIDAWVYILPTGDNGAAFIEVGATGYPFNPTFSLNISSAFDLNTGYEDASEESFGTTSEGIAQEEWVHLRLLCAGNVVRQYINGVQQVAAQVTTVALDPIGSLISINRMIISSSGTRVMFDDVRATIGGSSDAADFTPPTSPWPNP
jgi:hypothetical protein